MTKILNKSKLRIILLISKVIIFYLTLLSCNSSDIKSMKSGALSFNAICKLEFDENDEIKKIDDIGEIENFSLSAPGYRKVIKGINLEGKCSYYGCEGYGKLAIAQLGTKYPYDDFLEVTRACFDIGSVRKHAKCCLCKNSLVLDTIKGLYIYKCKVKFVGGMYIDGNEESIKSVISSNNDNGCKSYSNSKSLVYWSYLALIIAEVYD